MANPNNVRIARESRGLSQKELAQQTGINQATLSKFEKGLARLSDDMISKLSVCLDYPISFFDRTIIQSNKSTLFYRKRQSIAAKQLSILESRIDVLSGVIDELSDSIDIPSLTIPSCQVTSELSPEEIAFRIRQVLNVKPGPVKEIVKLLEKNGVIVIFLDNCECEKFDGLTRFTSKNIPVVWINNSMPNDRKRFSLAHELGHIVMHLRTIDIEQSEEDIESQANLFASEFLMPANECRVDFFNLKMKDLALKKAYWKVSKQSIIVRAKQLGCISSKTESYFFITLGRMGERKVESVHVDIDEPMILKKMTQLHLTELDYTMEEFVDLIGLNNKDIEQILLKKPTPKRISIVF